MLFIEIDQKFQASLEDKSDFTLYYKYIVQEPCQISHNLPKDSD